VNVRAPLESEYAAMAAKGREFWLASPFKSIPYDPASMIRCFAEMTSQGLMLIAEEDGAIYGGIGGVAGPAFFNDAYTLGSERFWWLDPAKRAGRTGLLLIREFEDAARRAGCHYLAMMALEASDPDRAEFIYRRFGFEPSERMYTKELTPWA
jgi:GNAT superfamily N-acetyltransferase